MPRGGGGRQKCILLDENLCILIKIFGSSFEKTMAVCSSHHVNLLLLLLIILHLLLLLPPSSSLLSPIFSLLPRVHIHGLIIYGN
jgi:hypothetical protein